MSESVTNINCIDNTKIEEQPLETAKDDTNNIEDITPENDPTVCEAIYNLKGLYETINNPPLWVNDTIPLTQRHKYVVRNAKDDCHVKEFEYKPKERLARSKTPKTLICHDMMGGYLLDKYIGGINQGNGFTFHRWAQTDIFCYFSHHFITIPTLPWINLAHKFGSAIIGTVITEPPNGRSLCLEIFKNEDSYEKFADALVEVCVIYKFEGWLLNIENEVHRPDLLLKFVRYLTKKMHERISGSYVIWYDSVTYEGKLEWQNELNEKNRCYFDNCDGIYLNYTWQEKEITTSREAAKDRALDVYAGIDIWGRGSYGGGTFNAYKAAKLVYDHNMSMAIFAHGWVHENNPKIPENDFLKRYYSRSSLLWKLFWPYMYTTPIEQYFTTFFRTGVTTEHYNLESQEVQPSYFPAHAITTETRNVDVAKDICRCVQERIIDDHRCLLISNKDINETDVVHRLFATQIELQRKVRMDIYTEVYNGSNCDYEVILLLSDNLDNIKKIICASKHIKPKSEDIVITPLQIYVDDVPEDVPKRWEHRHFILEYPEYKILEIGIKIVNGNYLNVCGFGVTLE